MACRLLALALLIALPFAVVAAAEKPLAPRSVPLIHVTDLFHPHDDPDDHVDLATILALPEIDLRAVILDDHLTRGGQPRTSDPGFVPVAQLGYLTGRVIPTAAGPAVPLASPTDAALDRPNREQAGVELILRVLRESPKPVFISSVGSARAVAAAFNRDPKLMRRKVRAVLLSAGSTGRFLEWNVGLDRNAYIGLMRSGLPIYWYPCATDKAAEDMDPHNGYFLAPHADLLRDLPAPLASWFAFALTRNPSGSVIRPLLNAPDPATWNEILGWSRNMWSTAMFTMAAGRELVKTADGWRFLPTGQAPASLPRQTLALDPVRLSIDDQAMTSWSPTTGKANVWLYRREPTPQHAAAMTEAVNALLRGLL